MSKRILALLMSVCLLLTIAPMPTFATTQFGQSENLTVNPDEQLVLKAAGDNKSDCIPLSADQHELSISKTTYYSFTAPSDGTVTITIGTSTGKWYAMYYPKGANGSYSALTDTQPDSAEVKEGNSVILGIRIYDSSKWSAVSGTLDLNISFIPVGGETPEPECQHTNTSLQNQLDANCVDGGYSGDLICGDCGKLVKEGQSIPALGHKGGEASCTEQATCTECGNLYGPLNPDNHFGGHAEWKSDAAYHWHVCTGCHETFERSEHSYDDLDDMICDTCLYERTPEHVCGGANLDHHEGQEATCQIPGWKDYYLCSCGIFYEDADCQKPIGNTLAALEEWIQNAGKTTKNHTEVIDKAVAPDCTNTGLTEGKHCSVCGEVTVAQKVIPANGHNFVEGECDVCGEKNPNYVYIVEDVENADCYIGDTATFVVVVNNQNVTYQWFYSTDNGQTWLKFYTDGEQTGVLNVAALAYRNNYQYKCVITNADGETIESKAAVLTATAPAFEILSQPENVNGIKGNDVQFTVDVNGRGLTYQWFCSTDGWVTWNAVAGGEGATLQLAAEVTAWYKCRITDVSGKVIWTDAVKLQVLNSELNINTDLSDVTCEVGGTVTFNFDVAGDSLTYKWFYSTDGGQTWLKFYTEGEATGSLTLDAFAYRNGYQYKCIATDITGKTKESKAATLTVTEPVFGIVSQPENVNGIKGNDVQFTVLVDGRGLTYQWFCSTDGWVTWNPVVGGKEATLSFVADATNAAWYKCRIMDVSGKIIWSDAARLQVTNAKLEITNHPDGVQCELGDIATFEVEVTGDSLTFKWFYSTDGGQTWLKYYTNGEPTAKLEVEARAYRNGYMYMCEITDAAGNTERTEAAKLTIG